MKILLTCPFWLSSLLNKEIKSRLSKSSLDFQIIANSPTSIQLEISNKDSLQAIYLLNLWSRLANKVYLIIWEKNIETFDQLFDFISSLNWWDYLTSNNISIKVHSQTSQLSSEKTIQSIAHKAILNNIQKTFISPPDRGVIPTLSERGIFLHIENNKLKVCLNTSWNSLHQRWYRVQTWAAPLKENLATGMVLLSWWRFKSPLLDPFCGSWTILIEAWMIAKNIAPWLQRSFAFQQFKNYDENERNKLVLDAKNQQFDGDYKLIWYDIDAKVLEYAQWNAQNAGLENIIKFEQKSFPDSLSSISNENSRILSNPPYGKRLDSNKDLTELYNQISLSFWNNKIYGWLISSYQWLRNLFDDKTFSHKQFYNWADEVSFFYKKVNL